ncbi:MAG: protein-glutamate O-methyltransferase CheR [Bacteroidota bacterium]|nr:protein-glutamate O-methyltransferase CheR [Bacteroidota bacterium]
MALSNDIISQQNLNINSGQKSIALSIQCFETWRKYIYDLCGIYYQDNKKYLLESRLLKRINFLGLNSFEEYFDYVKFSVSNGAEKKYLYEAITINETFFFRNQPQIDAMMTAIIPEIMAQGKRKIRVWSAASSSGEEAYSLSISFFEVLKPKFPALEMEIVGTDISNAVVETAKKAVYKEYSIRNTPSYYLKKYFKMSPAGFELVPHVKQNIQFKLLNLYDDIGMRGMSSFDIVICANVLIYFDQNSKIKVVNHLYNSLNRGGYLFIGYSETLHNISKSFKIVNFPKTVGYKKE